MHRSRGGTEVFCVGDAEGPLWAKQSDDRISRDIQMFPVTNVHCQFKIVFVKVNDL